MGRGERRHQENHRRAAQADRDPRQGEPGALRQAGADHLPRGLANEGNRVTATALKSLEEVLQAAGSTVEFLRNSPSGPNVYPGVPPEYTNWRDETQAWQKACVLFNLSFHMADLYVEGPDATKLLSQLAINTFKNVSPERAKQFVP